MRRSAVILGLANALVFLALLLALHWLSALTVDAFRRALAVMVVGAITGRVLRFETDFEPELFWIYAMLSFLLVTAMISATALATLGALPATIAACYTMLYANASLLAFIATATTTKRRDHYALEATATRTTTLAPNVLK